MDGCDPLSDQDVAASQHRDELACVGLQFKANNADLRCKTTYKGDDSGIKALNSEIAFHFPRSKPSSVAASQTQRLQLRRISVSTQPRPVPASQLDLKQTFNVCADAHSKARSAFLRSGILCS